MDHIANWGGGVNVDSILISDFASATAGKLTVVGVFNTVPTGVAPVTLAQLSISVLIHAHSSEASTSHELEIRLLNSRREEIGRRITGSFVLAPLEEALPGIPLRHISVHTVLMPEFPELGPYAFEVYIDGTYHAAAAFYIGPPPSEGER